MTYYMMKKIPITYINSIVMSVESICYQVKNKPEGWMGTINTFISE